MKILSICSVLLCLLQPHIIKPIQKAVIRGQIKAGNVESELMIYTYKYGQSLKFINEYLDTIKVIDNKFNIDIELQNRQTYIELTLENNKNFPISGNFINPGDSISINEVGGVLQFSGKGSEKFALNQILSHLRDSLSKAYRVNSGNLQDFSDILEYCRLSDSIRDQLSEKIDGYKGKIEVKDLQTIYFNKLLEAENLKKAFFYYNFILLKENKFPQNIAALIAMNFHEAESRINHFDKAYPSLHSPYICEYLEMNFKLDSCLLTGRSFKEEDLYQFISNLALDPVTKERIIAYFLYKYRHKLGDSFEANLSQASKNIHSSDILKVLSNLSSISAGKRAYNFYLHDTTGKIKRLSDYRGKVVVMDFWFTRCGNCRDLAPILREVEKKFIGKEVVFLSINVDSKKDEWIKSIHSGIFASDFAQHLHIIGTPSDDPIMKNYMLTGFPKVLLIDKQGCFLPTPKDGRYDNGNNLSAAIDKALL